jgi:signal transduction histidine kinase
MKRQLDFIRNYASVKVGFTIVVVVIVVTTISLGFLFHHSRQLVRQEAIERATKVLDKTAIRVRGYLNEVETATRNIDWLLTKTPYMDSLSHITSRIILQTSHVDGCSITLEPEVAALFNGYFTSFSIRSGDSVLTFGPAPNFDIYAAVWYRTPRALGHACWLDPYDDPNLEPVIHYDMVASYCKPIYAPTPSDSNQQGKFLGVITNSISLNKLSNTISREKPYPNSYSILLGPKGEYFVHPDSTKLFGQTIFSGIDPKKHPDIIVLGHDMIAGKDDYKEVIIDGQPSYVFYQPLEETGWSIGIVCFEKDILGSYNSLVYVILISILVGTLIILLFCIRAVGHFVSPLGKLAWQAHHITTGHFDELMPMSKRNDLVGQLQNSFVSMQQSLNEHISKLQSTTREQEERNQQLLLASQLVQESDRKKLAFIQDVSHQIRTPLNIIQGFFRVLLDNSTSIPYEERESIADTMQQNAFNLSRIVHMFADASKFNKDFQLDCNESVACNDIARMAVEAFHKKTPYNVVLNLESTVPDSLVIQSNRQYLFLILRELLLNAKKFASGSSVRLIVKASSDKVFFIVEDHGPGIPESQRSLIFKHFMKANYFSEGLGLGLYLSKQFAHKLGGDITLDSQYTSGCRFILEFPLKRITSHH